ncbi:MAG: HAD-IA family hydrolase [Eubacteriales bacterium]|nr:HAD-IA family hydrolase [Eubacteriales bacterium]
MRYTHLFWDFDGTLYNSYPQVVHALERTLKDFHIDDQSPEKLFSLVKISVHHVLTYYGQQYGLSVDELHEHFHEYHRQEGFFPAYEGLKDCLSSLHQAGARHYLYTHRDVFAWRQLERDGLRTLFTDGVTSEDGFPQKPAPDALLALMERNRLRPEDCVMIGDRDIDILSGLNAGMSGIIFDPDGYCAAMDSIPRTKSMNELRDLILFG